ncbi:hypothetical protein [uncultured Mailhella sp.]|uniref:hypothetical protein n=1 Tax=uncultured Mailhella sp. TaxID=1981031 RepID=UPI0025F8BDA3|nr:hypothetical protein [uncultured Mailhella sp.]
MAFTEQDLRNQKQEIARLADELSRLNSVFAEQKKALGIPETETVTVAESEVTPELRSAMADAMERARREGEARAARAKLSAGSSSAPAGRSRRGAMIV